MADEVRRYRHLVPVAVAFSLLGIVAVFLWSSWRTDDLGSAFSAIDWRLLPLALVLHVVAHLFWAARYALIANGSGVPLGPVRAWSIVTAGVFGGAVTPGRIGGEGLKLALLARRGVRAGPAGRLLVADRAADLVFFMLLGVVAIILLPPLFGADGEAARRFAILGTVVLGVFIVLLGSVLLFPRRIGRLVEHAAGWLAARIGKRGPAVADRVHDFMDQARAGMVDILGRRPVLMMAAMVLTAANWIAEFGAIWIILQGFGHDVPYWAVFLVGIVLTMIANIPITPGGSGVAEVAALSLLTPLAPGLSPLFVVVWRGSTYYYDLIVGGLVASVLLPRSNQTLSQDTDNP